MLKVYAKRRKTIRSAFFGMITGGVSLLAIHYIGSYIGFTVPINLFNTIISLILGIPGTAIILGVNLFL